MAYTKNRAHTRRPARGFATGRRLSATVSRSGGGAQNIAIKFGLLYRFSDWVDMPQERVFREVLGETRCAGELSARSVMPAFQTREATLLAQ